MVKKIVELLKKNQIDFSKPVLYYAEKNTYLLSMILFRLAIFRNQKAVLVGNAVYGLSDTLYPKFKESGIFDDIIVDKHRKKTNQFFFSKNIKDANGIMGVQELTEIIGKHFDELLQDYGYKIEDFCTVVFQNDHHEIEFETYLMMRKMKYVYPSCFGNIAEKKVRKLVDSDCISVPLYGELRQVYPFSSFTNEYVIPLYLEGDDTDAFDNGGKEVGTYTYNGLLDSIEQPDKKRIITAYDYKWTPPKKENNELFIFQGFGPISIRLNSNSKYVKQFIKYSLRMSNLYVYQCTIDYFHYYNNNIFVKTHPNVPINDDERKSCFNKNIKLLSQIPVQFYHIEPEITNYCWKRQIMFGSSANYAFSRNEELVPLTISFSSLIPVIHRLYFAIRALISVIDCQFIFYGLPESALNVFCNLIMPQRINFTTSKSSKPFKYHHKGCVKFFKTLMNHNTDQVAKYLNNAEENEFFVFLDNDVEFFKVLPHIDSSEILTFAVDRVAIKNKGRLVNLESEHFFIFNKNQRFLTQLQNFHYKKTLPMVGIINECSCKLTNIK